MSAANRSSPGATSSASGAPSRPAGTGGNRITEAHHQARRALAVVVAFALASPVAAVVPHRTGSWLPLHLFLVGAILSAIAGTTQYLAVTWSNAPAPSRVMAAGQRWCLGGGVIAVAAGRELPADVLTELGGSAVTVALLLVCWSLVAIRQRGTTPRFRPAIDAYLLAITSSLVGITLGVVMAVGATGDRFVQIRSIHLAVNVFGLVGLVLAGTVPFFVATQMRSKMSKRATPRRIRLVIAWLTAALAVVVAGHVAGHPGLAAAGYASYALGLLGEVSLLPPMKRRNLTWGGPRLWQLATGWLWWVGTTTALAVHEVAGRLDANRILVALVVGGFAQMLIASLAYLGPVLRGGGGERLTAGFAVTRSWPSLVFANLAAAALVAGLRLVAAVALAAWMGDVALRAIRLLSGPGGVVRRGPAG